MKANKLALFQRIYLLAETRLAPPVLYPSQNNRDLRARNAPFDEFQKFLEWRKKVARGGQLSAMPPSRKNPVSMLTITGCMYCTNHEARSGEKNKNVEIHGR